MFANITDTGTNILIDILRNAANSIVLINNDNLEVNSNLSYSDIEDYVIYTADITNSFEYNKRYIKFEGLIDSTISQSITHVALAFIQQNTKKLISIIKINPIQILEIPQSVSYILDFHTIQPIIDGRTHFQDRCIIDYKILNYDNDLKYSLDNTKIEDSFKIKYDGITEPYQININVDNIVNFDATTSYIESGLYPPSVSISEDNTTYIKISTAGFSKYGNIYFMDNIYNKYVIHNLIYDDKTESYISNYENYFGSFYDVYAFVKPNKEYKIISRIFFPNTWSEDSTIDYSSRDFPDYNIINVENSYETSNVYTTLYIPDNYLIVGEVGSTQFGEQDGIFIYKKVNDEQILNQPKIISTISNSRLGCSLDHLHDWNTGEDIVVVGEYNSLLGGYGAGAVRIFSINTDGTQEEIYRIDGTASYENFGMFVKLDLLLAEDENTYKILLIGSGSKAYIYIYQNSQQNLFQVSNNISSLEDGWTDSGNYIILKTSSSILVYKYENYNYSLDMSIDISSIQNQTSYIYDPYTRVMFISYNDYNNYIIKIKPVKLYLSDSTYEFLDDISLTDVQGSLMMGVTDGKLVVLNSEIVKIINTYNYNIEASLPSFGDFNSSQKFEMSIYSYYTYGYKIYDIIIPYNKRVFEYFYKIPL